MDKKLYSYEDVEHIAINILKSIKQRVKTEYLTRAEYETSKSAIYELLDGVYHFNNEI